MPPKPPPAVRLHKYLADLGIGSRRAIETWIARGEVRVNDEIAQPGARLTAAGRVHIRGQLITIPPTPAPARALLYHKPEGEICTRRDPRGRPTVYQNLPAIKAARWIAVGRLDINTRGLLLFTNDGQLANRLMHPRYEVEREYLCRVYGELAADALTRLQTGVRVDGELLKCARAEPYAPPPGKRAHTRADKNAGARPNDKNIAAQPRNNWYSVVLTAGKYRAVRRLWEAVGGRVSRLIRVRYGEIVLPKTLAPGQWRELSATEITKLYGGQVNSQN